MLFVIHFAFIYFHEQNAPIGRIEDAKKFVWKKEKKK